MSSRSRAPRFRAGASRCNELDRHVSFARGQNDRGWGLVGFTAKVQRRRRASAAVVAVCSAALALVTVSSGSGLGAAAIPTADVGTIGFSTLTGLFMINGDGSGFRQLPGNAGSDTLIFSSAFSPSTDAVAVGGDGFVIWTGPKTGGDLTQLTARDVGQDPAWSPDGS